MILVFSYSKKVGINEFVGGQSKATFSCYQATRLGPTSANLCVWQGN